MGLNTPRVVNCSSLQYNLKTACTLQHFILAMALHPDIQRKAHAQLDLVVGNDRLPDFDDKPSLPYLEAIVMEVLRWHPAAPIGNIPIYLILGHNVTLHLRCTPPSR